jgi:hypothetical protein
MNQTIPDGTDTCLAATQVITTGGNGSAFAVSSGAAATLTAGQRIILLPSNIVSPGGYFHASVNTTGQYCEATATDVYECDAKTEVVSSMPGKVTDKVPFLLFPNPAKDLITIRKITPLKEGATCIEIFNELGMKVFTDLVLGFSSKDYPVKDLMPGIYVVKIRDDDRTESLRMMKY